MKRWCLLVVLAVAAPGCVTGHLLDAARQIERPIAYREAALDGDDLLLRYAAAVTDDNGKPLGRADRRAAIALADLRANRPVDDFPARNLDDHGALPGRPVVLAIEDANGRPFRLVLDDGGNGPPAAFYSTALTRRRTALWAYPLLPLTLAFDAATNPILLFFAPAVIVFAD